MHIRITWTELNCRKGEDEVCCAAALEVVVGRGKGREETGCAWNKQGEGGGEKHRAD